MVSTNQKIASGFIYIVKLLTLDLAMHHIGNFINKLIIMLVVWEYVIPGGGGWFEQTL